MKQPTTPDTLKGTFVGLDQQIDSAMECIIGLDQKNIAALGGPGLGKTKLVRALGTMISYGSKFHDSEWTATSTPSHFLGAQDFQRLMEAGELVHNTEGYPPECEIWHAEEGFKAQGPLLDLLLPFGEDRKYMNGKRECKAKTVVWLVSSNELPNEANGAICDRFAIIFFPKLDNVVDRFIYSKKVSGTGYDVLDDVTPNPRFSIKNLAVFHDRCKAIEIPDHTIMVWDNILEGIRRNVTKQQSPVRASVEETCYRGNMQERGAPTGRVLNGLKIAKARAYMSASKYVEPQHLCAALPVLVVDPEFRDGVQEVLHSWALPNFKDVQMKASKAMMECDNLIQKQFKADSSRLGLESVSVEEVSAELYRDCVKAIDDAVGHIEVAASAYTIYAKTKNPDGTYGFTDERVPRVPKDMSYLLDKLGRYKAHITDLQTKSLTLSEG